PAHVTEALIAKLARARVLPYLDMPIQHADDGMLRAMRRGLTRRRMAEIVEAWRRAIPGATLRTTVLVGFPGETEAAFEAVLEFLEVARFDRVGVFTYSAEEGTPAASLPDPVPAEVAAERGGRPPGGSRPSAGSVTSPSRPAPRRACPSPSSSGGSPPRPRCSSPRSSSPRCSESGRPAGRRRTSGASIPAVSSWTRWRE